MKSLRTISIALHCICMALYSHTLYAEEPIQLDEIVITGESVEPTARPKTKLKGDSLKSRASSTLGQTLSEEPGIQNASFGPGVGVPVIRGLTGSRVKTLSNNAGSHDVSTTSPDHAVTIEPLLAEEIEVLRGPAVVRYGSGALGGAVNVKDIRIPKEVPLDGFDGSAEIRYGSNASEKAAAVRATAGKNKAAFHVNGFRRTRNNMDIPDKALDEDAIIRQFGDTGDLSNTTGEVPNTDSSAGGFTLGTAYIGQAGQIGASFQKLDNEYGIPLGGHGLGTHTDPDGTVHGGPIRIDMEQSRIDTRAEWTEEIWIFNNFLLEFTDVDYEHTEAEGGNNGTVFDNETQEARLETNWKRTHWTGSFGLHGVDRDFGAEGDESFVSPSNTIMGAAYLIQGFQAGPIKIEASARIENQKTTPDNDSVNAAGFSLPVPLPNEFTFSPKSAAMGLDWEMGPSWIASFLVNWAERAPDVQELLSIGPHFATQSYEVGSQTLKEESSRQYDVGVKYSGSRFGLKANAFFNDINNFIYLQRDIDTFYDTEKDSFTKTCLRLSTCLPWYSYKQANAEMIGSEAEVEFHVLNDQALNLTTRVFTDVVHGEFKDSALGDVPRLPPWRYGIAIEASRNSSSGSVRWTRAEEQDRPGLNETKTDAYHVLGIRLQRGWAWGETREVVAFLNGNNLLDDEVRNSVSFLRNFSLEPGRSVEVGLRISF